LGDLQERRHNPLINSPLGGRALSAIHLPFFLMRPPRGYGVLTTTGRKTGKRRRRCIRAIPFGEERIVIVAIKGSGVSGWAKNMLAQPTVELRLPGGRFAGVAREVSPAERQEARTAYCESVHPFEYAEHLVWKPGRPNRESIRELHRGWFDTGTPFVIDLSK
jgi:deazaflavin-dependent oxidoreductase (nitroreductase family)